MERSVAVSDDGVVRCAWAVAPEENRDYHDHEWGRPVVDEVPIFEKLCLEGFQSGLSWLTILRKREAFRRAFANFDIQTVARFGDDDVTRLLADAGIVRNRAKIEATIGNARAVAGLEAGGDSLAALVWRHEPAPVRPPRTLDDLAASTPDSTALSKELRVRGLRFVGPTTVYAAMQSLGLVNDHMVGCHARRPIEEARGALVRPR
jgi:DNA-3-methyladenine glycosylase I